MEITINNQIYVIEKSLTISELIDVLFANQSFSGVAVAINDIVIPKTNWDFFYVNQSDKILLIKATQGG